MSKVHSLEDVGRDVRRVLSRRKPRPGEPDLAGWQGAVDELLDGIDEFIPAWTLLPCVFRVARVEAGGTTVVFSDNLALPGATHTPELIVEMLNFVRQGRELEPVTMPLLLRPDEIDYALTHPGDCHCDEERELAARPRSWKRLGMRRSKRLLFAGQKALDRDGRKCTVCDATRDLHAHSNGEGRKWNDAAGYITLCRRCHVLSSGELSPAAKTLRRHLDSDTVDGSAIESQLSLVFEKGSLRAVAVAVGREYVAAWR